MSVCTATAIVIRRQSSSLSEGGDSALRWHFSKASYGNEWRRSGSFRLHVRAFKMNEVSVGGRHSSCAASQSITPISAAPGGLSHFPVTRISSLQVSAFPHEIFVCLLDWLVEIGWLLHHERRWCQAVTSPRLSRPENGGAHVTLQVFSIKVLKHLR